MSSAVYTCHVQFLRRDQFRSHAMEFIYFVNLTFIFVVNILFCFSGICLNSLVIVSFWRSMQLRKKLCYFMIMVLSCCDLLVILTINSSTALMAMLWVTEKINVYPAWLVISYELTDISIGLSLLALFVMNFNGYLATHYPIFHRTSVTKRKLLTLLTFLIIIGTTVRVISINDFCYCIIFIPPMFFINYKLFTISRKSHRNNQIAPEIEKSFSLKNISSCLLVVVCLIVLSAIPLSVYIVLRLTSKEKAYTLDNAHLAALWARTTSSMNSSFNCLIFYWKNKTLRAEGIKVTKSMKIC